MKVTDPLLNASFTKRINRFLASVHIDGREEYAHIPNSGRMGELLITRRPIKPRERKSRRRKTRYDIALVDYHGRWVSIYSRLPGLLLNESADPHFAETLKMAHDLGLKVFAFNCEVTEREITLKDRIGVIL